MMPKREALVGLGWAIAVVGAASVAWFEVFPLRNSAAIFAAAIAVPAVAAALTLNRAQARPRLMAVTTGAVVAFLLAGVLAIIDGYSPLGVFSYGTVIGWKQILTVALPVPALFPYVAGPVLLTGIAASVAVLAKGRPSWSLFVPAMVVWLAGLTLGIGGPLSVLVLSAPLVVVVLARLVDVSGTSGTARSAVMMSAVVLAVFAGFISLLAAPVASGIARSEPFDPRSMFEPPVTTEAVANPLDQLSAQLASNGGPPVLQLRASGPVNSPFIAVTTYANYDGVRWRIPGSATPASGSQTPAAEGTTVITETVTGSSLTSPWVPHTGEVVSVDTAGVYSFKASGVLLDLREPSPAEYELQVTSVAESPDLNYRAAESPDADLLAPACLPAYFRDGMEQAARGSGDAVSRIAASQTWLVKQSGLTFARNAPGGHSCSRLEELAKPGGNKLATSEQAATILTLGLRSQGIPARLAYGYRLPPQLPDGTYAPTAADAVAYTQVLLEPGGWVGIDAAPSESPNAAAQSDLKEIDRKVNGPLGDQKNDTSPDLSRPVESGIPGSTIAMIGLLAAVFLGVVGWILYAASRKRRARRLARNQRDLRAQVISAWIEAIASLSACDVPVVAATVTEVARAARVVPGAGDPVWELGSLVEHALYNPVPMAVEEGKRAFELADQVAAAVSAHQSRVDRLKGLVDRRSAAEVVGSGRV